MNGLFITGTDTGVGKTVLAAALLAAARRRGLPAAPMKPIQTGCTGRDGTARAPDLDFCLRMAGMADPPPETYAAMAPCRLETPCSPHLAAVLEGVEIRIEEIERAHHALRERFAPLFVEGAGGILVPIDDRHTMRDLARRLGYPVLIAARPILGTLNHTLLTIEAIREAQLQPAGVVLVESEPLAWGAIEHDNRSTIECRGGVPVLGVLPHIEGIGNAPEAPPELIEAGARILDRLGFGIG